MSQNSPSQPYDFSYSLGRFYFQTDHGLTYSCAFTNITESILPGEDDVDIQDFEFFPDGKPVPDPRVADTVINIMDVFLNAKESIVMYVCDANDRSPQARQALFTRWHSRVADRYDHQPIDVSSGGITVHGGLFTSKEFLYPDVLQDVIEDAPRIIQAKFGG